MKSQPVGSHADDRDSASLRLCARAKLNLHLEVIRRRGDGYHDVRTLMHSIALADVLRVSVQRVSGGRPERAVDVACLPTAGLGGAQNLAHRAASIYLDTWAQLQPGAGRVEVSVVVEKRIPVAGGLGGGSADAAATLRALAAILGPKGGPCGAQLLSLAGRIGVDVPFCLRGGAAWGLGKGDELTRVQSALSHPVVVGMPETGIRSADAYAWWDQAEPDRSPPEEEPFRPPCVLTTPSELPKIVVNGLRPAVAGRMQVVDELLAAIRKAGAVAGEMSGSGPAVFGVFADRQSAGAAVERLAGRFRGVHWILTRLDPKCDRIWGSDLDGR